MSNEKLRDSLSAMMDNAADELEVRRVLANADEDLMATWSRYQIARSVMHKETVFPELNIASAVAEAIAKEDEAAQAVTPVVHKSSLWSHAGKFAVAASILTITLSAVYFLNDDDDIVGSTASVYAQNEVPVEGLNVAANNDHWVEQKMTELIDKHEKQGVLAIEENDPNIRKVEATSNN